MEYFNSKMEGEEPSGPLIEMMTNRLGKIEDVVETLAVEGKHRYERYKDRQRTQGEAQ